MNGAALLLLVAGAYSLSYLLARFDARWWES